MLQELDDVAAYTVEGKAAFMRSSIIRKAVIRSYEVVGEIAKRLPEEVRHRNPQMDWRKLIGFRDFLAHHYEELILEYIWDAVEDLPVLRAVLEGILIDLDDNDTLQ